MSNSYSEKAHTSSIYTHFNIRDVIHLFSYTDLFEWSQMKIIKLEFPIFWYKTCFFMFTTSYCCLTFVCVYISRNGLSCTLNNRFDVEGYSTSVTNILHDSLWWCIKYRSKILLCSYFTKISRNEHVPEITTSLMSRFTRITDILIIYGNECCADSSKVPQVRNFFMLLSTTKLVKILLRKFKIFPLSIKKPRTYELREKESRGGEYFYFISF